MVVTATQVTVTGRNKVARKVAMAPTCELRPVRKIARAAPVRNDPTAATMSTAAKVDITTLPTMPESATRMTAIQTPEKIAAQRSVAPAAAFNAVCQKEPQIG